MLPSLGMLPSKPLGRASAAAAREVEHLAQIVSSRLLQHPAGRLPTLSSTIGEGQCRGSIPAERFCRRALVKDMVTVCHGKAMIAVSPDVESRTAAIAVVSLSSPDVSRAMLFEPARQYGSDVGDLPDLPAWRRIDDH